jgi:NAD(P)H-dependent flavin oxidoreductase YrpB (nitropropane dioxygenase family)
MLVVTLASVRTSFTDLVGCEHPLQQAPMGGGIASPELAGAVSRAGALGMLCEFDAAPAIDRIEAALTMASGGAVGMGFFGQLIEGDLDTFELAADRLRLVEVFWTAPDPRLVARAHRAGDALVGWQVGSVDDALAAEAAGCDLVIAQGVEAGGHVRGTVQLRRLLDAVCGVVLVPVLAAGGISSARGVADAIANGAAAVRVGTRFVATAEANAHDLYKQALVQATSGDDTVLTTTFSLGWPDAPHRVLASSVRAADSIDDAVVAWTNTGGTKTPIEHYATAPPTRTTEGRIDAMALYAGTGVGAITQILPASTIVAELTANLP